MGRQLDDAFSGPGGGGGGPQGAPADVGRQLGGGFNAFPAVTQQQPPNLGGGGSASGGAVSWPLSNDDTPKISNIQVQCEKTHMRVSVEFDRPFFGMIFSKGHYSDPNCVHLSAGSGNVNAAFEIRLNQCGMTSSAGLQSEASGQPNPAGSYVESTIIVQYDPQVQEVFDQARKLRCTWYDYYEKSVTFRPFQVNMLNAVTANFLGDNLQCWMQIQSGKGPWSSEVSGIVKIGQTMTMVLGIKDQDAKFDMMVRNCVAHDGQRSPIQLVDEMGCVIRPKIMSKFNKIKNFGSSATVVSYAYFQAFKFPDSMNVHFQCVIQVCRFNCPDPVCPESSGGPDFGPPQTPAAPNPFTQVPDLTNNRRRTFVVQGNAGFGQGVGGQALPPNQLRQATAATPQQQQQQHQRTLGPAVRPRPLNHQRLTNRFPPPNLPGLPDPRHTRQGREGFINLLQFNNLQQVSNSGQHQPYGVQSEQDNGYYIHSRAKRSDESEEEYRNRTLNMVVKTGGSLQVLSPDDVAFRLVEEEVFDDGLGGGISKTSTAATEVCVTLTNTSGLMFITLLTVMGIATIVSVLACLKRNDENKSAAKSKEVSSLKSSNLQRKPSSVDTRVLRDPKELKEANENLKTQIQHRKNLSTAASTKIANSVVPSSSRNDKH